MNYKSNIKASHRGSDKRMRPTNRNSLHNIDTQTSVFAHKKGFHYTNYLKDTKFVTISDRVLNHYQ